MSQAKITVTCLTYNRTDLLRRTVESFVGMIRDRSVYHRFVLLDNGSSSQADISFARSLERVYPGWMQVFHLSPDHYTTESSEFRIHHGMCQLFERAIQLDTEFIFHLEDDWEMIRPDTFIDHCLRILRMNPSIGQIRLRRCEYDCSPNGYVDYNFLTKEKLRWGPYYSCGADTVRTSNLHWSNNPTMVRTEALRSIFATAHESEVDVMRRFRALNYKSAQLFPGAFDHIGPVRHRQDLIDDGFLMPSNKDVCAR